MATYSSALAWKILWTEEPGSLQSTGSQESDTTERLRVPSSLSLGATHFPTSVVFDRGIWSHKLPGK